MSGRRVLCERLLRGTFKEVDPAEKETAIGNNNIFSFDTRAIIINAAFGTASQSIGNQMKVDFRNLSLGEGVSQTINLTGAAVDAKTKEQ